MMNISRLRWLAIGLAVWAAAAAVRLVQVQLIEHRAWEAESARQRERTHEVEEPRGAIISRDGRLLAGSIEGVAVYANPRKIPRDKWSAVAAGLSGIVGAPRAAILKAFSEHDGFFYLAKHLDSRIAAAVAQLDQRGVGTLRTERRVYPNGSLAGPTIGFVNSEGDGQTGLEAFYDRTLRGVPSVYRELRDGKKTSPTQLDLRLETAGRPGQSLVLALDCRVQEVVEEELQRTLKETRAKSAAAVVMDPNTGELVAIGSLPSYDPGHVGDVPAAWLHNRAVEDAFEPGSTFKPFVVATAMAAGVLRPSELVDCSGGGVQVANLFIHDHARFGLLPVREVLAKSSNAGAIRIALRVTANQLDSMIRSFGFGEPTHVELPAEASGIYRAPRYWSAVSQASLALGQEISVTALQMAQAYAAIANGGLLVRPTLVTETTDQDGRVLAPYRQQPPKRILPPAIAFSIATMLEAVVEEGTGVAADVPGFHVAGKTGTAQRPSGGSYAAGHHVAWFAGFLPMPNPRLVIVVCVDQPATTYWAAEVAAPTFGRIASRVVTLLGIPPTGGVKT
jgi:cell division protein FtsI (penicillin-binding protein 3)